MSESSVPGPARRDLDVDAIISSGRTQRSDTAQLRTRRGLALSLGVLVVWALTVTITGAWGRVVDNWVSALTMVFGSFVAGSTPQGGGAVAFPVFTKVLEIDASVARTFSLCIQTIGMGTAALAIIVNKRNVAWRSVAIGAPVAVATFVLSATLLGDRDTPFWPSKLPGPYVKVSFTILVAAMAAIVWLGYRVQILERIERLTLGGPRVVGLVVAAAAFGGVAASLTGSGADVIMYLAIVVIIGVTPRVGIPSSVVLMAIVSVAGFVLFGIIDGQLDIVLDGDLVTSVGGRAVGEVDGVAAFTESGTGLDAGRFDLYGLWLAAAPVVAFGAPLGSWVSSLATDRQLVRFAIALAVAETLSTIIFLDGLVNEPDPALIAYGVVGSIVVIAGLWALKTYRHRLLGLPSVDFDAAFTRTRLDTGPGFREQLRSERGAVTDVSGITGDTTTPDDSGTMSEEP